MIGQYSRDIMLISFNFEVHQPHRLKKTVDTSNKNLWNRYFDVELNKEIFNRVANKCYIPANRIMLDLIDNYDIKIAYSITGVFLEQAMEFNEEVLDLFKDLVKTGNVELIGETYHHSLSGLFENHAEFREDIENHKKLIKELFNYKTEVFRNTELLYNNKIAETVKDMGFKGIFTEGAERILGWRSPNYVYSALCGLNVLLRNYQLSDDIGFRFSCSDWEEYPLTADKYANWLANSQGDCINIYIDYETFGEHQWKETGIFEFLKALPLEIEKYPVLNYATPSEILDKCLPRGSIDVFEFSTVSWADSERDVSAWLGNGMQRLSFKRLKSLKEYLGRHIKSTINSSNYDMYDLNILDNFDSSNNNSNDNNYINNNSNNNRNYKNIGCGNNYTIEHGHDINSPKLMDILEYKVYKNFQTSDNFYYQCTKGFNDMDVHSYFSHFETPYSAFATYLDALYDFKNHLILSPILKKYMEQIVKLKNKAKYYEQHNKYRAEYINSSNKCSNNMDFDLKKNSNMEDTSKRVNSLNNVGTANNVVASININTNNNNINNTNINDGTKNNNNISNNNINSNNISNNNLSNNNTDNTRNAQKKIDEVISCKKSSSKNKEDNEGNKEGNLIIGS
jgi:alpha-amylase